MTLEPHHQFSTLGNINDRTAFLEPEDQIQPFLLLKGDPIRRSHRWLEGQAFLAEEGGQLAEMVVEGLEGIQEIGAQELGSRLRVQGVQNLGEDFYILTGNGENAIRKLGQFHRVDQVCIPVPAGDSSNRNRSRDLNNIWSLPRLVRVQDEEIDWSVYHALLDGKAGTMQDLAGMGYDPRLIEESVRRLERYYLVERAGDSVRVLSFQESLLLCQAKNDETCPFVVENGVIRTRPDQGKDP